MTNVASKQNSASQNLDPVVDPDGTVRLKRAVGDYAVTGITAHAGNQGIATHTDLEAFAAGGAVVLGAGYDGTAARKVLVDTTGRQLVDIQARKLRIVQTPTISNGAAYAAKDVIGALLTFAAAARTGILSGVLESVTIVDKGQQMAALDLVLFNTNTVTVAADNAIFAPTDADLATCVGVIPILAGDYKDFSTNSLATVKPAFPFIVAGTTLYGVLVSRGTPTYTSTTDLVVSITVSTD